MQKRKIHMTKFGSLAGRIAARKPEPTPEPEELTLDALRGEPKKDAPPVGALAKIRARKAAEAAAQAAPVATPNVQEVALVDHILDQMEEKAVQAAPKQPSQIDALRNELAMAKGMAKIRLKKQIAALEAQVGQVVVADMDFS